MTATLATDDPSHLTDLMAMKPDEIVKGDETYIGKLSWHDENGDNQNWHTYRIPVFADSPLEFLGYYYVAKEDGPSARMSAQAAPPELAESDTIIGLQWRDESGVLFAQLTGISFTYGDFLDATGPGSSYQDTYLFLAGLMDGRNTITGSAANAIFEAGGGASTTTSTVTGGRGDETLRVWHDKNIVFDGNGGSDTIEFQAYLTTLTPVPAHGAVVDLKLGTAGPNPYGTGTLTLSDIENVVGTTASDHLTGNNADNRLDGFEGGDDTIAGGVGNDTVIAAVGSGGAVQTISLDGGDGDADTLIYSITNSASTDNILDLLNSANNSGAFDNATISNFEIYKVGDLTGAPGTRKVDFRGTDNAETVTTGNAADTIDGKGGNDTLAGGRGGDTIHGGAGDDTIYNKLPDITDNTPTVDNLYGDAGNDTLDSFRGTGIIDGGDDTDKAVIDRRGPATPLTLDISDLAHTSVAQDLGDGTSIIRVEQVAIVGGDGGDSFTGGALADVLDGGLKGDNTLVGNGGADLLTAFLGLNHFDGGAGNDTIHTTVSNIGTPNAGDVIDGGADADLLQLDAESYDAGLRIDLSNPAVLQTLADGTTIVNIERIEFSGGAGKDIVTGGAFADVFGFSYSTSAGNDVFNGAGGNDTMFGGEGNDTLNGGADKDRLTGGSGKDALTGGLGRDTFDFNAASESAKGARHDTILDFKRGQDKIDLDTIDASSKKALNQDFKWIGKLGFHDKPGELHYVKKGADVIVEGDINGDGKADFQIEVSHIKSLGAGDFFL